MTAVGMWPENSRACLSLSQLDSYHVQGRRRRRRRSVAAAVEVAVDGTLDFFHMNSPELKVLHITSLQHHYCHLDRAAARIQAGQFSFGELCQVSR